MSKNPSFAELWKDHKLPNRAFTVGFPPFIVKNIAVNGINLPSFPERRYGLRPDWVNLHPDNADWLPFFSSIKSANMFFNELPKNLKIHNKLGMETGIIFDPVNNEIFVYTQDREVYGEYYVMRLGDFSLNTESLLLKAQFFDKSTCLPRKLYLPTNNPTQGEIPNNWDYSGMIPFEVFNIEIVQRVQYLFASMYGHKLSRLHNMNRQMVLANDVNPKYKDRNYFRG